MPRLLVGLPALAGAIEKFASKFDLVEVRPVDQPTPKDATLNKWRRSVPPAFAFSVVLPRVVADLSAGPARDEALATSLRVAQILEARCIVLITPPTVRPTSANKKRIAELFERLPREGVARCWEAHGMWERDDVIATAKSIEVSPVFDAAREALAPGPVAYTRLRALGKGTRLGAASVDRVAERIAKRREAFVVIEGTGALRTKKALEDAVTAARDRPQGSIVRSVIPTPLVAEDEEQ